MVMMPTQLPKPGRTNFAGTPGIAKKRVRMDDGFYQDSRAFDRQTFMYTLTWALTWEQLKIFEAFLEYSVFQDGDMFVVDIPGSPVVRPLTQPTVTYEGGHWSLALQVEQLRDKSVFPARTGVLPMWPSTLPTLEAAGYTYNKPNDPLRSDIDGAIAEMRSRFRHKLTKFSGKIIVDEIQRVAFWAFFNNELIDGVANFLAPYENGFGRTMVRAKFSDQWPGEINLGALYEITLNLETGNAPIYTRTQYNEAITPDVTPVLRYFDEGYIDEGYALGP